VNTRTEKDRPELGPVYTVNWLGASHIDVLTRELARLLPRFGSAPEDEVELRLTECLIRHMGATMNGETPAHTKALKIALRDGNLADLIERWRPAVERTLEVLRKQKIVRCSAGIYRRDIEFDHHPTSAELALLRFDHGRWYRLERVDHVALRHSRITDIALPQH
jgi:hypothetical protein